MAYKNPEDIKRYRKEHRKEARERARLWRLAHPGAGAKKAKEWREKNPQKYQAQRRAYREKNREHLRQKQKEWRERTGYATSPRRLAQNKKDWLKKYNISPVQFDAMLAEQNGTCAICGSANPQMKNAQRLYVDHCHATGKNRGLLCFKCNTLIGNAMESTKILRAAIAYLERDYENSGRSIRRRKGSIRQSS